MTIRNEAVSEQDVQWALQRIIASGDSPALNYAVNYAKIGREMTGYELHVQCLYVLCNISRWRGQGAKEVRDILKRFTKKEKV